MKKLHGELGHDTTKSLVSVLGKASYGKLDKSVREGLDKIIGKFDSCRKCKPKPSNFKVYFPESEIYFNHEIEVDLMWVDSHPVLNVINSGTRYSVVTFLENMTEEHVWNVILNFWITVLTGYPSYILHDQGNQFTASYSQISCSQMGVMRGTS